MFMKIYPLKIDVVYCYLLQLNARISFLTIPLDYGLKQNLRMGHTSASISETFIGSFAYLGLVFQYVPGPKKSNMAAKVADYKSCFVTVYIVYYVSPPPPSGGDI